VRVTGDHQASVQAQKGAGEALSACNPQAERLRVFDLADDGLLLPTERWIREVAIRARRGRAAVDLARG
jgi:hypothetical protein